MRGASEGIGLFVDLTGFVSLLFSIAFLIAFTWQFGWPPTVGLIVIFFVAPMAWALVSTLVFKGDSLTLWIIGTIAIWALMFPLGWQVSWFGMLG